MSTPTPVIALRYLLPLLLTLSCLSASADEKAAYLEKNNLSLDDFFHFNLTSVDTEIYYYDRILTQLMGFHTDAFRRDNPTLEDNEKEAKITEIIKGYESEKADFNNRLEEFVEGLPAGYSLYFVSFRTEGRKQLEGYYAIKDGVLVRKDLIEF